jgi:hypothetical protein
MWPRENLMPDPVPVPTTPLGLQTLKVLINNLRRAPEGQLAHRLVIKTRAHEPREVAETAHFLMAEIASHENFVHDEVSTFVMILCDFCTFYTWPGKPDQDPGMPPGVSRKALCDAHRRIREQLGT